MAPPVWKETTRHPFGAGTSGQAGQVVSHTRPVWVSENWCPIGLEEVHFLVRSGFWLARSHYFQWDKKYHISSYLYI